MDLRWALKMSKSFSRVTMWRPLPLQAKMDALDMEKECKLEGMNRKWNHEVLKGKMIQVRK